MGVDVTRSVYGACAYSNFFTEGDVMDEKWKPGGDPETDWQAGVFYLLTEKDTPRDHLLEIFLYFVVAPALIFGGYWLFTLFAKWYCRVITCVPMY